MSTDGKATRILYNGTILTMDPYNTQVAAIAVHDDRILATGSSKDMLVLADAATELCNLGGATVVPGFYDAHGHFFLDSECHATRVNLNSPPIAECRTFADCLDLLKRRAITTPPGQWVQGYGFDDSVIAERRFLTRHELDQVSTEHPIFVIHISGHFGVANSLALKRAGLTCETLNPVGGIIQREADGTPNGVLEEAAVMALYSTIPTLSEADFIEAMTSLGHIHAAKGITTSNEAGVMHLRHVAALRRAAEQDRQPIRVVYNPLHFIYDTPEEVDFQSPKITRGGVKLILDGSIQCYTAYLSKPYHTAYNGDSQWCGYPHLPREQLFELVRKYHEAGVQCVMHTNGDAATQDALDAIEAAQRAHPVADPRFLLVHAQNAREDQLDRCMALGVTLTFFTAHAYYWGDRHKRLFLGPERASRQNPMRSALDRGLVVSSHNDAPVTPADPMLSMWACVNRLSASGEVLGPEQRISVLEALRAHTINAAWQNFEERDKGSLEPGKLADMAVLDANPLTCPPETLRHVGVTETLVGGKTVYLRN